MTLDDHIARCRAAIRNGYACRNAPAFGPGVRQQRIRRIRCESVRRWIKHLRMAVDPNTSQQVTAAVFWFVA